MDTSVLKRYRAELEANGYNQYTISDIMHHITYYLVSYEELSMEHILEYDRENIGNTSKINIAYHLSAFLDWTKGKAAPMPGQFIGSSTGHGRPTNCMKECVHKALSGRCRCKPLDVLNPIPTVKGVCQYFEPTPLKELNKRRDRQSKHLYDRMYGRPASYVDSHSAAWK